MARPLTAALEKGYDVAMVHDAAMIRDVLPVIPLTRSGRVKRGEHLTPECPHGAAVFAGPAGDGTRWACPAAECRDVWRPAPQLHPVIPRETDRFRALYRGRAAVEREFGRLKHEWGLGPLRVRGLVRVRLHADLTILARLATSLCRARLARAR